MAGSRLERIGSIYSRTTGLIQSGALSWEDRPLWYDIYKAFPPKEEPTFDRPAPDINLKKIFYQEDKIRAIFHGNNKQIGASNLLSTSKTLTQKFIDTYYKLGKQYKDGVPEEQLYKEAVDILNREKRNRSEAEGDEESVSLSMAFKQAKQKQEKNELHINLKDIF